MSKRPEAYSGERCERKKIDEELALSAKKIVTLLSFYKEKQYYLSLKLSKAVRKLITILQEEIDNGKLDQYHLTAHDIKRSIIQYISENTEFFKEINPQIAVIIASSAPNISGAVCCGFLHRWEIHFLLFTERANLEN